MVEGFQNIHERFNGVDRRLDSLEGHVDQIDTRLDRIDKRQEKIVDLLDQMAGRVDDLWTESASQTITNRRYDVRLSRIEEHLGLDPMHEEIEA